MDFNFLKSCFTFVNEENSELENQVNNNSKIIEKLNKEKNQYQKEEENQITPEDEKSSRQENTKKKIELCGFKNIGHSCYMNSFLQILLHTPSFLEELKKSYKETTPNDLIESLINLSNSENQNKIKSLIEIKKSMAKIDESYGKKIQNDSHEFGIDLINQIINIIKGEQYFTDEDISEDKKKIDENYKKMKYNDYLKKYCKQEIPIEKLFLFHEINFKVDINEKKNDYNIKRIDFDSFFNIELFFPKKKLKDNYQLTELLNYKYPKEPKKNDQENQDISLKQIFINFLIRIKNFITENTESNDTNNNLQYLYFSNLVSLPDVLIISINRAILGKPIYKDDLNFQETLDLKKYLDTDISKEKDTTYELYGINYCYKSFFNSGHYYCSVKVNNYWYRFDDDMPVKKEEKPDLNSKYVVGLFYIKKKITH